MIPKELKKELIRAILNQYLKQKGAAKKDMGMQMFQSGKVQMRKTDFVKSVAEFSVESDTIVNRVYGVRLSGFDSVAMNSTCSCPYDQGGLCKHEAAAIYFFLNYLDAFDTSNRAAAVLVPQIKKPDNYYTFYIHAIDQYSLTRLTNWSEYNYAAQVEEKSEITEESAGNNQGSYALTFNNNTFRISIQLLHDNLVLMHCSCSDVNKKVCVHKLATLIYLQSKYGDKGLFALRNFDAEKEVMLNEYGYTLKDDLKGKFDFEYEYQRLSLKVLDKSIQKIPGTEAFKKRMDLFFDKSKIEDKIKRLSTIDTEVLLFVFLKNHADNFPGCFFNVVAGKRKKNGELSKTFTELKVNQLTDFNGRDAAELELIKVAKSVDAESMLAPYASSSWEKAKVTVTSLDQTDYHFLLKKMGDAFDTIYEYGKEKYFFVANRYYAHSSFSLDVTQPHKLSPDRLKLEWHVSQDAEHIIVEAVIVLNKRVQQLAAFEKLSEWLYIKNKTIYKIDSVADVLTIKNAENTLQFKYHSDDFETIFKEMIKPLSKNNKVVIANRNEVLIENQKPVVNVYLKEYEKFFLIIPRFEYVHNDYKEEAELFTNHDLIYLKDEQVVTIKRDLVLENEYTAFFKSLHPDFEMNLHQEFFHLSFEKVIERGWFFELFDKLKQKEINVFGQNELSKIKYNPNRPVMKFRTSSGIDWFGLKMEVSFGDEIVPLETLRKAMMNRQFFVPLSDGTIGMLPEEWVARYARLFKIGKMEKGELQVSKMHFNMIDEFALEIDNEKLLRELYEKKTKLLNFDTVRTLEKPKNVNATLRHYQQDGFHWLNFLDEFGWGGCLADDMGLGKTLQVLTFLQHLKNEKRLGTSLVVVPTTLIFNWKNEVEKFCKKLKLLIHRGVDREVNHDVFGKYDIVLTTYGTLRSDIEDFKEFNFHYVILDESQAIKNITSQIAKAVRLLKAKNRLVMTGTPIENNTFDLYSQMEFLNPGFLGSQEFFRTEYATAIDKNGDEFKAAELRKMIAPFVLKRTKEEVAKDLPEKTETILYCEMGKPQRKVYDAVKKKYREAIMNKMEEEGLNKSGFLILEGLLKLRMVCDSPALIGTDENDYGQESAKLEELIREIAENAGHHKILVFSQFLKMLDLVKQKLEALQIPYQYLDGQTVDRKEKVDSFQSDDSVRVFLISLKAGGVGINLTEADYVYLVDPWWNPAVERQAIDRTHRIGQKKNVFAYKMICKDTIEEKIIQLQEKKKTLASNLIDTEKNILKKLNKDDIVELFG